MVQQYAVGHHHDDGNSLSALRVTSGIAISRNRCKNGSPLESNTRVSLSGRSPQREDRGFARCNGGIVIRRGKPKGKTFTRECHEPLEAAPCLGACAVMFTYDVMRSRQRIVSRNIGNASSF